MLQTWLNQNSEPCTEKIRHIKKAYVKNTPTLFKMKKCGFYKCDTFHLDVYVILVVMSWVFINIGSGNVLLIDSMK